MLSSILERDGFRFIRLGVALPVSRGGGWGGAQEGPRGEGAAGASGEVAAEGWERPCPGPFAAEGSDLPEDIDWAAGPSLGV